MNKAIDEETKKEILCALFDHGASVEQGISGATCVKIGGARNTYAHSEAIFKYHSPLDMEQYGVAKTLRRNENESSYQYLEEASLLIEREKQVRKDDAVAEAESTISSLSLKMKM